MANKWWSPSVEVMTLGRYQLENLADQRVPFLLIDMAAAGGPGTTEDLARLAPRAVRLTALEIPDYLRSSGSAFSPDLPIVLLCEDGKRSMKLAQKLAREGDYKNVYVVEGGWAELL
jgi:rhodanese-related sulfurtransferase